MYCLFQDGMWWEHCTLTCEGLHGLAIFNYENYLPGKAELSERGNWSPGD
jgi:hypothetical protein